MEQRSSAGLIRGLRRWDLIAVAINAIIGAGIFGIPAKAYAKIGAYSLIAFAACALVVTLIVLCFAEVGSRYRESGGPYLYAREAFGPAIGFEVGWMMWLARLTAFAANLNLLVHYLAFFWPGADAGPLRAAVITVVVTGVTAVNIIGIRDVALVTNLFTVAKLLPLLIFIGAGLFFLKPQGYSLGAAPSYSAFSASVLLLVYAFTGFEMAAIPAGDVKDPQRDVPIAILTAIGTVTVLYILIQIVCIGTLPELASSERPLADASSRFLGTAGAAMISGGALLSIIPNLNVVMLAASRLPFAMAGRGELPRFLSQTHSRFHTPHFSIALTALLMLVLTLYGSFINSATLSAIARLLAYAGTCAALPVLRFKPDVSPPLFKLKGGIAVSVACLVLIAWLLSISTVFEATDAVITALISAGVGLVLYAACRLKNLKRR